MGKTKITPVADNTATGSPVTTTVEMETTVEQQPEVQENEPKVITINTVVVMCYKGTMDVMKKIWKKHLQDSVNFIFREIEKNNEAVVLSSLVSLLTDKEVPAAFFFVPANVIPCSETDLHTLLLPVVYVKKSGERAYNSNLPMFVEKEALMEILQELDDQLGKTADKDIDELVMKAYLERNATRPVEVSHNFGNFVTLVARANPCTHTVIEGFLRKKFVTVTSPEGFNAIIPDLKKAYNLDNE